MSEPFKKFEIRWGEYLGRKECPFLRRWVITAWGYSIRLHHWLGGDDPRFYHDHAWDFWAFILKGEYWEQSPDWDTRFDPARLVLNIKEKPNLDASKYGTFIRRGAGSFTFYPAEYRHIVRTEKGKTCWSLVFSKPKRRNFGYWIPGRDKPMRHLRYFSRYGLHPCE